MTDFTIAGAVLPEAGVGPAPRSRPSLKINFSWSFLGTTLYAASQWGMLTILAKFRSASDVGVFAYALALATPAYALAQFQLRQIQTTDVQGRFTFATYLKLRVLCVVIASAGLAAFLVWTAADRTLFWTCLFVAAARAVESLSDILYGAMQLHEEMRTQALSLCLKGAVSLPLMAAGLWLTGSVAGAAVGLAVAWTILLLVYDIPATVKLLRAQQAPGSELKQISGSAAALLQEALPLGLVMFLLSLNVNLPRYFLKANAGTAALGIFAAMSYVMVAGTTVVTALGQTVSPRLARCYQFADRQGFKRLLVRVLLIGLALGAAGVAVTSIWGRQVLTLLYNSEYGRHGREFLLIAVAAAFTYVASFLGYAMTAALRFRPQLIVTGLATLTLAASCAWLVPSQGITGAAWSCALSALVLASGAAVVVRSAVGKPGGSSSC